MRFTPDCLILHFEGHMPFLKNLIFEKKCQTLALLWCLALPESYAGPGELPAICDFSQDEVTREILGDIFQKLPVKSHFAEAIQKISLSGGDYHIYGDKPVFELSLEGNTVEMNYLSTEVQDQAFVLGEGIDQGPEGISFFGAPESKYRIPVVRFSFDHTLSSYKLDSLAYITPEHLSSVETQRFRLTKLDYEGFQSHLNLNQGHKPSRDILAYGVEAEEGKIFIEDDSLSKQNRIHYWGIEDAELGEFLGSIGIYQKDKTSRLAELTFNLRDKDRSTGVFEEVMPSVRAWIFKNTHVQSIETLISAEDLPSKKLAERVGFSFTKIVVRKGEEFHIYRLSKPSTFISKRLSVGRLSTLSRSVTDIDRSSEFYRKILKFRIESKTSDQAILTDGRTKYILNKSDHSLPLAREINNQKNHFALGGPNLSDVRSILDGNQVPHKTYPVPGTPYHQLFFQDPDGYHIEIVEVPLKTAPVFPGGFTLHHISHATKDLVGDSQYLTETIGLRQIPRPPFKVDGIWLSDGEIEYHLVVPEAKIDPLDTDGWGFSSHNSIEDQPDSQGNIYSFEKTAH